MFCPKCNYRAGDEYRWCPKCGTVLQEETGTDANSLEAAMKMQSTEVERRNNYANAANLKKVKKDMTGSGIGLLSMSLLHVVGILWSFMFALFGEDGLEFFSKEITEGSYGEIGRTIVYNSGNVFETNTVLMYTEILMGIALLVVAIMCFCARTQKMCCSTIPCTLFFAYFCYTIGLFLSYLGIMGGGDNFKKCLYGELFEGTYIGYIVVAAVMTIVAFISYLMKKKKMVKVKTA